MTRLRILAVGIPCLGRNPGGWQESDTERRRTPHTPSSPERIVPEPTPPGDRGLAAGRSAAVLASDSAATPLHDECQSWNRAQQGRIAVADV